jgi:hypothetical protein
MDLKSNYYEIHIMDVDVEKMAMKTSMVNFYEFLVILFGLCNAPLAFTTFMKSIFHYKLNEIVIIYIDDILVYSKSVGKHV